MATAFVPAAQRKRALAWFALLQEFTDAAWGGSEATPGLAKLAWWQEELHGWARGARRHPLAAGLQAQPAPWAELATVLAALPASRERPRDVDDAIALLRPFAQVIAGCEAVLFTPANAIHGSADAGACLGIVVALLGERLLQHPQQAVPMQLLARHDSIAGAEVAGRAWAGALLEHRADTHAVGPRRIHAALLRARLHQFSVGGANLPLSTWRVPFVAWTAARAT